MSLPELGEVVCPHCRHVFMTQVGWLSINLDLDPYPSTPTESTCKECQGSFNIQENRVKSDQQLVEIAAVWLSVATEEAAQKSKDVPETAAVYFWTEGRGGGAVLVGKDGSALFATSSVSYDDHLSAFLAGKRSDERDKPEPDDPER